ncbi:MAG: nucleoside monophosphate kinase [Bdellovibrio sp.]|nr:nucleoside monophosphate kinase [Bdellovibrio sp.]
MARQSQLIFLGAPGSGKGTQANYLVKNFGYKHVSTGDLLRAEIGKGSSLGMRVKGIIDAGHLVDDMTVLDLLKANCDTSSGHFIFDGFPRTLNQAKLLDEQLLRGCATQAVYFKMDLEALVQRITNRRVAPKSGMIYNLLTRPPKRPGICDVSGEPLIHRKDDTEEVIRNRIDVFKATIDEMVEFYTQKGILKVINANAEENAIRENLLSALGLNGVNKDLPY